MRAAERGAKGASAGDQSGPEKGFQADRVATIAAGHVVHDTYTSFLPPLLPRFIADLSLSRTEAGVLTVFMQVPSLLQPFIGHLADRVSLRYLVILAPAATGAMMSLLGVASDYALLALLLVAAGLSSAGFHAVAPAMTGRLSGAKLGRGLGFWMIGGEIGRALGPIVIVTALVHLKPPETPYLMLGGLLATIFLYIRLRDVRVHASARPQSPGLGAALRHMRPLMVPLIGIVVVRGFMMASLTIFLPTFLTDEGAGLWLAGAALTLLEAAGVAGALLGGWTSDRLGRRPVLLACLLASPVFMFVFLGVEGWAQFAVLLVLGVTLLGVAPVALALVQEHFPENRALASGLYMSMSFMVRSLAVVVLGLVGDLFGLRLAFAGSALLMLLGVPLVFLLPRGR